MGASVSRLRPVDGAGSALRASEAAREELRTGLIGPCSQPAGFGDLARVFPMRVAAGTELLALVIGQAWW